MPAACSRGPVARYVVLFAMTDPEAGARGITAFVVDAEQAGFHRGKVEPKMGIRASATCEIELTDYRCPVENRLGEEGQGFKIAMGVLDAGRIGDRKSTRLNSSHVAISYAVFC